MDGHALSQMVLPRANLTLHKPDRWSITWYVPSSVPPAVSGPYTQAQILAARDAAVPLVLQAFTAHRQMIDSYSPDSGKTYPFKGTLLDGYEGGFTHQYLTTAMGPQQVAENLLVLAHPSSRLAMTNLVKSLSDPALGVDLLEVYAADYRVANEGGCTPCYSLYPSSGSRCQGPTTERREPWT